MQKTADIKGQAKAAPNSAGGEACPFLRLEIDQKRKQDKMTQNRFREDKRFRNIKLPGEKIWLASPTMHEKDLEYVIQAYETNWISTVGENIEKIPAF